MNTSSDPPCLDCAYKRAEYAGRPCRKGCSGKATWPGCKQVYRPYDAHGVMMGDTLTLQHDMSPGEALLQPRIRGSMLLALLPPWREIRAYVQSQRAALPPRLRALTAAAPYPLTVSDALRGSAQQVDERQASLVDADRAHWGS